MTEPNPPSDKRWQPVALIGAAGALVVGAIAFLPLASTRTAVPVPTGKPIETKLASIPVEGMVCLSCAAAIKQKLKSLDGVQNAEVHFAERVVVVNYAASRPDIPLKAVAAINSLGYKARPPMTNL